MLAWFRPTCPAISRTETPAKPRAANKASAASRMRVAVGEVADLPAELVATLGIERAFVSNSPTGTPSCGRRLAPGRPGQAGCEPRLGSRRRARRMGTHSSDRYGGADPELGPEDLRDAADRGL